jgi:acetolactate synthase-1/2/3 large subunit
MADLRHGGRILVDQLALRGVQRVFSVPGESFLAALDALHDSAIELVTCRQEGGAAMMAEAQAKLTGRPGVLFVTRGPGATNAVAGLHVARHDSTPMVVFVGQVARSARDRDAFQEIDISALFGSLVKWAAEVRETERLPEYIARAWALALSGRPGPVVLGLPEDMLSACADVPDIPEAPPARAADHQAMAETILSRIRLARRPVVIAGGSGWSAQAAEDLEIFAETQDLPVVTTFRRQDYMDNRHPNYVGDLGVGIDPALAGRIRSADLLLVLGSRLGDIPTAGFRLLDPARPDLRRMLIHVHPDPDEIGRLHPASLSLAAPAPHLLSDLRGLAEPISNSRIWTAEARADYEVWREPVPSPGALQQEVVFHWLSENLPPEAIVTNGAGNYAAWAHRYYQFKRYGTQLAPTSGSMGYGLPAAIAARLEHPDRPVVCLAGDGCLQMTVNELSTAAQYGLGFVILVFNNGRYGTIRMHQERTYPGRVCGTELFVPDIPKLAAAYGGIGRVVTRNAEFAHAFREAWAGGGLTLLDLRLDPGALSTGQTLEEARAAGCKGPYRAP